MFDNHSTATLLEVNTQYLREYRTNPTRGEPARSQADRVGA